MPAALSILFLLVVIVWIPLTPVTSLRPLLDEDHPCDQPKPLLRWDQMTVLINGYSESRIPLLRSIAATYSASPSVSSVLILWGNPSTTTETLTQLSNNLSSYSAVISVIRQPSASLNLRFLPRPTSITTGAVLVCDDDVEIDPQSIEFAFKVWSSNRNRLVGFFARSHDIDLSRRRGGWIYTVHHDRYSIVLTKSVIVKTEYLHKYSCDGGETMAEARAVVEQMRNCEDILMNFVAAEEGGGPVLVGAAKARDWGDARNEVREEERGVREVGLSSRRSDHRKRRGDCIGEFHRILGKMPLRYSYGKVVNSVGEQGLCNKGGKLVLCDQQI